VRVRVGTAEQEFPIGDIEALWAVSTHVREVFRFVTRHTTLTEDEQRDAEYAIVEGVLGTLDPHTNLLRPDDFEQMKTSTKGSFGGLGIEVGMRDAQITVIRVIDGNPAAKAGLEAGDRIVQIDGESTVTMGLSEAVDHMRGEPGTTVTLHVKREGQDKPKKYPITRDVITLDSVQGEILPGADKDGNPVKVGLIQINRNFSQTTGKELRAKLAEFEKIGVRGVVLDMRDNPGGLLTAAVEVADAFVKSGTIVSTVGSSSPREELAADDRYDFPNVPLVVLIDQGSASATEIVAGALRNLGRAVLIGRRTFGKGSVQVLHDRKLGDKELALKLTIAQYLTPGDVSIQSVGVSPDLETIPVLISKEYVAYHGRKRFDLVREESLAAHLTSSKADPSRKIAAGPLYFLGNYDDTDDAETKKKKEAKAKTDKTGRPTAGGAARGPGDPHGPRPRRLGAHPGPRRHPRQDLRVRRPADRHRTDPHHRPPAEEGHRLEPRRRPDRRARDAAHGHPQRQAEQRDRRRQLRHPHRHRHQRGPVARLPGPRLLRQRLQLLRRARAAVRPHRPRPDPLCVLKLSVSEHELSRTDRMEWQLFDQHSSAVAATSQTTIDISSEGLPRPQFAYGYQILDDPKLGGSIHGNADGALQLGERVRMRVNVKNTGEGPALDAWVTLRNLVGESVFLHTGRENLKLLPAGETRTVEFDMEVKKAPENGKVDVQLSVADAKIGASLVEKLHFPLAASTVTFAAGSGYVSAPSRQSTCTPARSRTRT
jgi:carboxyl-terminal processing protease